MKSNGTLLFTLIYLFLSVTLFYSCNHKGEQYQPLLEQARALVEEHPDSTLILLDSISYRSYLDEQQLAEYTLLTVQAKDRQGLNISEDTMIFKEARYFEKKNDYEMATWANLYSGRIYSSTSDFEKAMKYYLRALDYSVKAKNQVLIGLMHYNIGVLYYEQFQLNEAIAKLTEAEPFLKQDYKRASRVYNLLANTYLMKEESDSAFFYYDKALDLAEKNNNDDNIITVTQNLSIAHREVGNYNEALNCLNQAQAMDTLGKCRSKLLLNFAKLYNERNKIDSAYYYVDSLIRYEKEDKHVLASTFHLLIEIEKKSGNYEKAVEYYDQYADYLQDILFERYDQNLIDVQKKYNQERLINDNNQLIIKQQQALLYISGLLILIILITIILVRYHSLHKRKIRERDEALNEALEQVSMLEDMARAYNKEEKTLKNEILKHFEIMKRISLLQEDATIAQVNQIIYGQKEVDWEKFFSKSSSFDEGIIRWIREKYSNLTEIERQVCYFSCAGYLNKEIAILLNVSVSRVLKVKVNIREKLNLSNQINLRDFFTQSFSEKGKKATLKNVNKIECQLDTIN